ncbi:MAG: arylsulfatase [Planctomycetes bacterium]|nr:arylsulfatase [Planctomycetota bacterium]
MSRKPGGVRRREFLRMVAAGAAASALGSRGAAEEAGPARRPNVVLIMTDDQGYGDLGCHGNARLRTPHLDRLAAESVEMTHFHVMPVCAPTRACLMTGRYNYRTGAIDTYLGRAMMHPDEVTLAEMLAPAGYRCGLFGKWHLGDNYPMRPTDQGFHEALYHLGGGLCQPSDPPGSPGYFDPILHRNGKPEQVKGYCTDVFTDAAIAFIEANRDRPFFAYLATNAPHGPLQVADTYWKPYQEAGLDEAVARTYGMIANLDENVGRLLARLKDLGLAENTVVVFLTDNGPDGRQEGRYDAGLRAQKGSVYDGGIRVPFFIRWPGRLQAGRKVETIAAHIDLVPTLLDVCGVPPPAGVKLDGLDLLPLLDGRAGDCPERTLYFQWHRGDQPMRFRDAAARGPRFKLVMHQKGRAPVFELYDMAADPGEAKDVAAAQPDVVAAMRAGYEAWFKDVSSTRGYAPPRIHLGTPHENPTVLSRQDWRGPSAGWARDSLGYWEVHVASVGTYDVTLRFARTAEACKAILKLPGVNLTEDVDRGAEACTFPGVRLATGDGRLEAWLALADRNLGVQYVEVNRTA